MMALSVRSQTRGAGPNVGAVSVVDQLTTIVFTACLAESLWPGRVVVGGTCGIVRPVIA
jgi:hypothetical protein